MKRCQNKDANFKASEPAHKQQKQLFSRFPFNCKLVNIVYIPRQCLLTLCLLEQSFPFHVAFSVMSKACDVEKQASVQRLQHYSPILHRERGMNTQIQFDSECVLWVKILRRMDVVVRLLVRTVCSQTISFLRNSALLQYPFTAPPGLSSIQMDFSCRILTWPISEKKKLGTKMLIFFFTLFQTVCSFSNGRRKSE